MTDRPNKQILVALGLVEHNGKFLMLRRVSPNPEWHHRWNIPGGKAAPGEAPADAVRREVLEEAGIDIGPLELLGIHTHHWSLPEHTQQTFLALYRTTAVDDRVILREEENDAHCWVTLDEFYAMENLLDGSIEMIRALYEPRVRPV